MLNFKTWLEDAGEVSNKGADDYAGGALEEVPHKHVSGNVKPGPSKFDPESKFGKKKKRKLDTV